MYSPSFWNPWRELERFQDEVGQLLSRAPQHTEKDLLPINVWVGQEGAILSAALPGVLPDSLDISVLGETLTLRGKRQEAPPSDKGRFSLHRHERPTGAFARTVQLPFRVDPNQVVAHYNLGVLELTLPRAAEDKPQRIAIKAA